MPARVKILNAKQLKSRRVGPSGVAGDACPKQCDKECPCTCYMTLKNPADKVGPVAKTFKIGSKIKK